MRVEIMKLCSKNNTKHAKALYEQ